ncbi:MAG TPA: hypothetical protein VFS39_09785, partial [Nitrospira sp.]|nr:hypothetical protein [Nitrospira sp.]
MASTLKRIGDLDIHQDLAFQRRSWRLQRVGWGVLAVIALAGLLGLFGQGPFSRTTAADPSLPFSVEYDRFARFRSPMILRILLNEEHPPRAMLDVWVSRAYLDHVQITGITPP